MNGRTSACPFGVGAFGAGELLLRPPLGYTAEALESAMQAAMVSNLHKLRPDSAPSVAEQEVAPHHASADG